MNRKNGIATGKHDDDARNDAAVVTTKDAGRSRRHFLTVATATMGPIGAAVAAWAFIASGRPNSGAYVRQRGLIDQPQHRGSDHAAA